MTGGNMKKISLAAVVSMLSLAAYAQAPTSEIRETTDPAKAAAVEQHAQDIQAQQKMAEQEMSSGGSGSKKKSSKKSSKKSESTDTSKSTTGEGAAK
jgi:hypothetical protein